MKQMTLTLLSMYAAASKLGYRLPSAKTFQKSALIFADKITLTTEYSFSSPVL